VFEQTKNPHLKKKKLDRDEPVSATEPDLSDLTSQLSRTTTQSARDLANLQRSEIDPDVATEAPPVRKQTKPYNLSEDLQEILREIGEDSDRKAMITNLAHAFVKYAKEGESPEEIERFIQDNIMGQDWSTDDEYFQDVIDSNYDEDGNRIEDDAPPPRIERIWGDEEEIDEEDENENEDEGLDIAADESVVDDFTPEIPTPTKLQVELDKWAIDRDNADPQYKPANARQLTEKRKKEFIKSVEPLKDVFVKIMGKDDEDKSAKAAKEFNKYANNAFGAKKTTEKSISDLVEILRFYTKADYEEDEYDDDTEEEEYRRVAYGDEDDVDLTDELDYQKKETFSQLVDRLKNKLHERATS
jgi:hypothetical protein